jgi:hypothetical protein
MKKYLFCFFLTICSIAGALETLQAKDPINTKITGMKPQGKLRGIIPSAKRDCSTYQFRCASLSELEFHE